MVPETIPFVLEFEAFVMASGENLSNRSYGESGEDSSCFWE